MAFDKTILLEYEDAIKNYRSRDSGQKAMSNYVNWFPIVASSDLAGIFADLMGDGHLQDKKLRLDYTSKSREELTRFGNSIYNLFKVKGKIRLCTTNKYGTMNYGVNCMPLGRVLKLIGVPSGSKVLIPFSIPQWILNDKKMFSRFVNRLISCEGCVDMYTKAIEIRMHKAESVLDNGMSFFKSLQYYLDKHFGIKSTNPFLGGINLRKDKIITREIRLKIKNKESLIKFRDLIGIEDPDKKAKLDILVSNINRKQYK